MDFNFVEKWLNVGSGGIKVMIWEYNHTWKKIIIRTKKLKRKKVNSLYFFFFFWEENKSYIKKEYLKSLHPKQGEHHMAYHEAIDLHQSSL